MGYRRRRHAVGTVIKCQLELRSPCYRSVRAHAAKSGDIVTVADMTPDLNVFRAAILLVERYGPAATTKAAKSADVAVRKGDKEGETYWRHVKESVRKILEKN